MIQLIKSDFPTFALLIICYRGTIPVTIITHDIALSFIINLINNPNQG